MSTESSESPKAETPLSETDVLLAELAASAPADAVTKLEPHPDEFIVQMLERLNPGLAQEILDCFASTRKQCILAAASPERRRQWMRNEGYPEGSIGRTMEPPLAVFLPDMTIADATAQLRQLAKRAFITYVFVADADDRLLGVVVMREMLLSENPRQRLEEIMIPKPFSFTPEMPLMDAMKESVTRHFPVYPVCDAAGRLVGLVRGQTLFEAQAFELSAQAGSMVGVEKEERLSTPWQRSLKFRHPWLQLNLLTAFVAAAVVGIFEHTIDRIVVLAVFLPVLAGQSGNTGCQALAVALRGITLGELTAGKAKKLVAKEALLGLCNGALVGLTAGAGMYVYASMQHNPAALKLGFCVLIAMTASCVLSGIFGATVPLVLKKFGADPATASSIFLTTGTDVASMGCFLGLATLLI